MSLKQWECTFAQLGLIATFPSWWYSDFLVWLQLKFYMGPLHKWIKLSNFKPLQSPLKLKKACKQLRFAAIRSWKLDILEMKKVPSDMQMITAICKLVSMIRLSVRTSNLAGKHLPKTIKGNLITSVWRRGSFLMVILEESLFDFDRNLPPRCDNAACCVS